MIDKQKKETIDFLVSTKIFNNFDPQSLIKIFPNFIFERIDKNSFLFKEGQEPMFIYFVKSGEFEISMKNSMIEINKKIAYLEGMSENYIQEEDVYRYKCI